MSEFPSEFSTSPEFSEELRERRSILASYVMANIYRASSELFAEDLDQAVAYTEAYTHYADGRVITDEDVNSLAASSILVQMVSSFKKEQPLVLSPDIPRALPVYHQAQEAIDEVGLSLVKEDLDLRTVLATARRLNGKDVPTTPNIEAAVAVLNERGTVLMEMESIDDIQAAKDAKDYSSEAPDIYYEEEDGTHVEGFNLSNLEVPSQMVELPYYAQFYEAEHGAEWLKSLLEDIKAIHTRMSN
jgi:hypothetical protein